MVIDRNVPLNQVQGVVGSFSGQDVLCPQAFKKLHAAFPVGPATPRSAEEEDDVIVRLKQAFEQTDRPLTAAHRAKTIAMLKTAYKQDGPLLTPIKRAEALGSLQAAFAMAGVHVHGAITRVYSFTPPAS